MLSDVTKNSIYRHLNVPVPGISNNQFDLDLMLYDPSVPYYSQPAALYERVQNLTPVQESTLSGLPLAQITLTGSPGPLAEIALTATPSVAPSSPLSNTPGLVPAMVGGAPTASAPAPIVLATYTPTPLDLVAPQPLAAIAMALVAQINASNTPYQAQLGPVSTSLSSTSASFASIVVQALVPTAFMIAITSTAIGAYVAAQGALPTISVSFKASGGAPVAVYGLVPILDHLEAQIATASDNAAIAKADIVTFAPDEASRRVAIYGYYQERLAQFFFGSKGNVFLYGKRRQGGAIA